MYPFRPNVDRALLRSRARVPSPGLFAIAVLSLGAASPRLLPGADCNGNAREDSAEVSSGESRDSNRNGLPDECELPQIFLAEEGGFALGLVPAAAVTDLNGDGLQDIVACVYEPEPPSRGGVALLLQRSKRELMPMMLHSEPPGWARSVRAIATGDFTGDGRVDIAVVESGAILLLRSDAAEVPRQRGLVGLRPQRITSGSPVETPGAALAVGDVDGDGDDDLVTTGAETSAVLVFAGGQQPLRERRESPSPVVPTSMTLLDADGDRDLDLALVGGSSAGVSILENDGKGVWTHARTITVEDDPISRITSADLDGDTRADLVVAGAGAVTTILAGPGESWVPRSVFHFTGTAAVVRGLAAADLGGDGDVDIVISRSTGGPLSSADDDVETLHLEGDGRGGLVAAQRLELSEGAYALSVRDLDGDGAADIACAPVGPGKVFGAYVTDEPPSPRARFRSRRLPLGFEPHSSVLRDLDSDGDLDLAVIDGEQDVHLLRNDGKGALEWTKAYSLDGANELFVLAAGDIGGDGDIDLAGSDEFGRLFTLQNGGGLGFRQGPSYRVGHSPWQLLLVDLHGDRLADILSVCVASNELWVFKGLSGGGFAPQPVIRTGASPAGAATADLDGDGDLDLALGCVGENTISILRNEGGTLVNAQEIDSQGGFWLTAADVDRDGRMDIVGVSQRDGTITTHRGLGGTLEAGASFRVGQRVRSATPFDLDGDGKVDLVTANEFSNTVSILFGEGQGAFAEPQTLQAGYDPRFVVAGDIDGDGDGDVIAANHSSFDLTLFLLEARAAAEKGHITTICTERDMARFSIRGSREGDPPRTLKFMAPARTGDPSLLPLVFQDVRRYPLHQDFLAGEFPDRFPALQTEAYERLTARRATRSYLAGLIEEVRDAAGRRFGFQLLTACFDDPSEAPTLAEVRAVHAQLRDGFQIGPLVYRPRDPPAREAAALWTSPGFAVETGDQAPRPPFRAYTAGVAFGRVRLLTPAELVTANDRGGITREDIIVLEQAPRDIEGVFAAIVTAEPQGELSHVAVRTARRGAPNAYLAEAMKALEPWRGRLVRLEIGAESHQVRDATIEEALTWWKERRPRLSVKPVVDASACDLPSLLDLNLASSPHPPEARYGGKATNLARLQRVLAGPFGRYQESGFAIPAAYYQEFLRINAMPSPRDPARTLSYEEVLAEIDRWEEFQGNAALRFEVLRRIREHMLGASKLPEGLLERLAERITEVFGSQRTTVRLRSSSNIEDALEFNGAGLYDSTSGCLLDDLDSDAAGPSLCDPDRADERPVATALRRVWASLLNARAHEERAHYGVPTTSCAMGVLVTCAFGVERANGVAFTGNPSGADDRRYLVTVQAGEESVVSPSPGVLPEKVFLEMEEGHLGSITRVQGSSLLAPGQVVLDDDQLRELGALLAHIDRVFPVDLGGRRREDVLLDVEFKIAADGRLAVKQVRPFLRPDAPPPLPVLTLEVPEGMDLCGAFVPARSPEAARELQSRIRLRPGRYTLPPGPEPVAANLVEEVLLGPERERLAAEGPGMLRVRSYADAGATLRACRYQGRFRLADGRTFQLTIPEMRFESRPGIAPEEVFRLDGTALAAGLTIQGDVGRIIQYGSCACEALPLWTLRATARDGLQVRLQERHRLPRNTAETGPAALVRAELRRGDLTAVVTAYWSLIYTASRHNRGARYRVLLEKPWTNSDLPSAVHGIDIIAPEPRHEVDPEAIYLDEGLRPIDHVPLHGWERTGGEELPENGR